MNAQNLQHQQQLLLPISRRAIYILDIIIIIIIIIKTKTQKKNSFHNLPSEAGHKNCPEQKITPEIKRVWLLSAKLR
jgi:hypothetical protein